MLEDCKVEYKVEYKVQGCIHKMLEESMVQGCIRKKLVESMVLGCIHKMLEDYRFVGSTVLVSKVVCSNSGSKLEDKCEIHEDICR